MALKYGYWWLETLYTPHDTQQLHDLLALQFGDHQETVDRKEYAQSLKDQYNEQRIEYDQEFDRFMEEHKVMKL